MRSINKDREIKNKHFDEWRNEGRAAGRADELLPGSDMATPSAPGEVMRGEECHLYANKHAIHAAWVNHAAA